MLSFLAIGCATLVPAQADLQRGESFSPTWRLLSNEQKQQFVAGYVLGLMDAARVTAIALEFSRANPGKAVESLEKIHGVFNLFDAKPTVLVKEIDAFFADPANRSATLSMAVNSARSKLATTQ